MNICDNCREHRLCNLSELKWNDRVVTFFIEGGERNIPRTKACVEISEMMNILDDLKLIKKKIGISKRTKSYRIFKKQHNQMFAVMDKYPNILYDFVFYGANITREFDGNGRYIL